jgi:hypothetical protein
MTDFGALFTAFHETMESEARRRDEVSLAVKDITSKARALGSLLQRVQRCKSMEGPEANEPVGVYFFFLRLLACGWYRQHAYLVVTDSYP